jgi:WD40 repeat protein
MIEFVRLTVQNPGLEYSALTFALWFGAGLIAGLLLAIASIAALAIECSRREQIHLEGKNTMRPSTGILVLAVALAGCRQEPQPPADVGQVLAAGLPGVAAQTDAAEQDSSPMVVRRLWFHPDNLGLWGGPSPDGRYLTYVDLGTDDLALHEFGTGEDRRLTDASNGEYAWSSAFAPDGERVAYSWANETGYDELRILELDGSGPRIVYADESFDVHPMEWSSDGERIVVRLDGNDEVIREIGLVTVADGSLRVLKTLDHEAPFEISMSPDGRSVIYDYPTKDDPSASDIYVLDVETGDERLLVEHPADDRVLGWAPDGGHVLFLSDRTGTLGAWLLPVADGRPAGGARLVKPDMWRIAPLGFARDGSYYYGVPMEMTDVYVAAFDPETGQLIDQPTRMWSGPATVATWPISRSVTHWGESAPM